MVLHACALALADNTYRLVHVHVLEVCNIRLCHAMMAPTLQMHGICRAELVARGNLLYLCSWVIV